MASSTPSSSTWHSVNPQTRPLTLSILELTPLALTLSLTLSPFSTTPAAHTQAPTQHIAHTHNHAHGPKSKKKPRHKPHSEDEDDHAEDGGNHLSPFPGAFPHALIDPSTNFKDLLSHGVVVSVNGQPWNRIVAHVSDPDDEPETDHEREVEDAEWEDEPAIADIEHNEETTGEGVTKRRPRKARFGASAGQAVKGEDKAVARRKRRPSENKERQKVDRDRAVVVVYGLSPGKEYEIELQVVGLTGPDNSDPFVVSNSVLIPPSPSPLGAGLSRSRANSLRSRSRPRSRSNSFNSPLVSHVASAFHSSDSSVGASPGRTTPPTSAGDSHPAPPIPTNILNPIDTQAAQIRHMIAAAHAEKEHVQTQIKEARRASQRAEAALRLEIETVKRATEKAGSLDLRAKQKALALQEQVKQGWAGAENAEKETTRVENGIGEQESRLESTKAELEGVKGEWKAAKDKEEEIRDREKKNRAEEEKKLQEVVGKIDKLRLKKEKKEVEKAELTKKLQDLLKQAEEIEKKNEEEKLAKSRGAYWWDPYTQQHHNHGHHPHHGHHGHDNHHAGRGLTNHPSLNNLSGQAGFAPRGRGGFTGRFASAGSVRPTPAQPSPTHGAGGFYPASHAATSGSTTSPAFRPPKMTATSPAAATRTPSSSGVNVAAMPFHPSNYPGSPGSNAPQARAGSSEESAAAANETHHTTLMPPQLQHRIYLPNVRPRPQSGFSPSPSAMTERQSPTLSSTPAFPPLPGTSGASIGAQKAGTGPSLASIVTRAVLSPTALAERGMSGSPVNGGAVRSPTFPTRQDTGASSTSSTAGGTGSNPTPTPPAHVGQGRTVSFGPAPDRSPHDGAFTFGSSAAGPWSGLGAIGSGMVRTSTPPAIGAPIGTGRNSGRNSPSGSSGRGSGPGSRKGTAE